ncbi:hypothetical protein ARAM_003261 [Aspergillus rambellii]|uniref:Uncharacterized protein n=2 Tax=Aspergillus subgen. Nidulantes TaxID=2720870 RepID=A0A0F8XUS8_9EURO|nr:hypothetical protein AOCH_003104 [Aspergillus ochraceoroseus]KKK27222.1 hypothetical protein ARAM_003261 [Aspergillus rambellii]
MSSSSESRCSSPYSSASSRSSSSCSLASSGSHSVLLSRHKPANSSVKPTSTFLFVDYRTDNPQNPISNQKKHAFVQKNYQRKKKQESINRLKCSAQPFTQQLAWGPSSENDSGTVIDRHRKLQQKGTSYDGSQQVARMSETWSLKAYLSQGYVDPFSSSAVHMTDNMNLYFHHFRIHTIASCYPLDSIRMSVWWWQRAITQPALLQALLFLTAGHQATLESINGISSRAIQKSTKDSLRLRGDTLKTLNGIMRDPMKAVAESTTLIVASLVAIEAVDANFEALEAHTKGLIRLVHLLGGLDVLDHMTLSKIYQSAVKSAALKNSRPIFSLSARWRSEILQESKVFRSTEKLETSEALALIGTYFFKAPWFQGLDSSMKTFLRVFQRLITYYEIAQLRPSLVMPTDNDLFLVFEHELLSASYAEETDVHEPLRLCLLIYLNLRVWHFQSFPFMRYMIEALRQSLVPRLNYIETMDRTLLFWILFVGGMASQGYNCHPWFVHHLTTTTTRLGFDKWETARPVLGRFFYTDQPGEKRGAEDLWNEVLVKESYIYTDTVDT